MRDPKPEIIDVDKKQLQDVVARAKEALGAADAEYIERVFESYEYVASLIQAKNMSIGRLQKLLFGAKTEKTDNVVGDKSSGESAGTSTPSATEDGGAGASDEGNTPGKGRPPPKGHGRNGVDAYAAARRVEVAHETLQPGDACPECEKGTVYQQPPRVVVRITGQAPLGATRYELQKLRCGLCGQVFTADLPQEAGTAKYDAQARSMIALLKYGSGFPFNRLDGLQGNLEIPLPASTQWDIVHALARELAPAYQELIRQAAQGEVLYNDDTTVKILDLMGQRRQCDDDTERTGLFTSGVVSTLAGHRIALFFSSRRHAGENLVEVLKQRSAELDAPIQMCDALSRNMPRELQTIVANCLAHGRRQFVDVHELFPEECRTVLEALKVVYANDAEARRKGMSAQERLQLHQAQSQAVMTDLQDWLKRQFDDKLVEPNSVLGGAIRYMLNHWDKLTLFLRQAGAPLDNNLCERALKKAILHRKNSLFYRSQNGALTGDLYMSLIHTCELNKANPFDYLTELQNHRAEVAAHPEGWMPWNYRETLGNSPAAA
jgi:hypothetical protein